MNLGQVEAESSIDSGTIRRPAAGQMRQLIAAMGPQRPPARRSKPSGSPNPRPPTSGSTAWSRARERAFDVVGALLLVALLAPVWLVIAL